MIPKVAQSSSFIEQFTYALILKHLYILHCTFYVFQFLHNSSWECQTLGRANRSHPPDATNVNTRKLPWGRGGMLVHGKLRKLRIEFVS